MELGMKGLIGKLKRNSLIRAVTGYAALAFISVQAVQLVSGTFGLSQDFNRNLIWVFIAGFPFLIVASWAYSSKLSTPRILGVFALVLASGYSAGTYIWVNTALAPQIAAFIDADDYVSAWQATNRVDAIAPFFSSADEVLPEISSITELRVDQDEVDVYWKPYGRDHQEWFFLGTTPLGEQRLPKGLLELKMQKEGFETQFLSVLNPSMRFGNNDIFDWTLEPIKLRPDDSSPTGMIYIPGGNFVPGITGQGIAPVKLNSFYIDKTEVTNRQFKEFMNAGGYDNRQYWVDMEFVEGGISLTMEQAKKLMVDTTGVKGPAGWEVGMYLDGQANFPVTGVSWYEALAYARYRGNILPPMHHWAKAAYPPDEILAPISPKLVKESNFSGQGMNETGIRGVGAYGTYDMAGNAREWVWNIFGGRGLTLGGSHSDPYYMASQTNPLPRMDRSLVNGFRTVRLLNARDMNPFGDAINRPPPKPDSFYKPMNDEAFTIYSRNFDIGRIDLKSKVLYEDKSNPLWVKERILVNLGYGSESMDILVFSPRDSYGKIGSVIIYPGANYFRTPPDVDEVNPGEYGLDFIVKSGRAIVWPAIKDSMNRISPMTGSSREDVTRRWRERLKAWTVDTYRTIDYIETRNDLDPNNIFYLGMSYGSLYPTHTLLFEKRFNAALLYVGGASRSIPPLSDGLNHLPRITTPILMLNGEQDYLIPKVVAERFYDQIGTTAENKRIVFYESGHWPLPRNQMIRESLAWMDKYSVN